MPKNPENPTEEFIKKEQALRTVKVDVGELDLVGECGYGALQIEVPPYIKVGIAPTTLGEFEINDWLDEITGSIRSADKENLIKNLVIKYNTKAWGEEIYIQSKEIIEEPEKYISEEFFCSKDKKTGQWVCDTKSEQIQEKLRTLIQEGKWL